MKSISKIEISDRPREKLALTGARSLTDHELLAILIGSGNKNIGVHKLAALTLATIDSKNGNLNYNDLRKISGIGPAKATTILAALEFARRRIRPNGLRIGIAQDVYPLLLHWGHRKQEHFIAITLNGAHEVIETRVITVGIANQTQVHPREVFSDAISDRACAIIVAHNHPSGQLSPSEQDKEVTLRLKQAGDTLGIKLLDHIIFSHSGFFSFVEQGLL